ncbi:MAG: hypothetical protein ABI158_09720 [Edaphobacter sp.]
MIRTAVLDDVDEAQARETGVVSRGQGQNPEGRLGGAETYTAAVGQTKADGRSIHFIR